VSLTEKWLDGSFAEEDVRGWLGQNAPGIGPDGVQAVVRCIMSIYNWRRHGWPPGGFATALLRNDFVGAGVRADKHNRDVLWVYAFFMDNVFPCDWRSWIEVEREG